MYRLFYIILSLSIVSIYLIPMMLVLRGLLARLPKKWTIPLWGLFYLRAICPVGMSSPFSITPRMNRHFHLLQQKFGLTMGVKKGLMTSWRDVLQGEIQVNDTFQMCTIFWTVGMLVLASVFLIQIYKEKKLLRQAIPLFDHVFQLADVDRPVYTGVFRRKMYVPSDMGAKEIKVAAVRLSLPSARRYRFLSVCIGMVMLVHWFNPFLWLCFLVAKKDLDTAEEEAMLQRYSGEEQSDSPGAVRGLAVMGLYLLCLLGWFGMSYLYAKWDGGAWGAGTQREENGNYETSGRETASLSAIKDRKTVSEQVIARRQITSPSGKSVTVRLVAEKAEYTRYEGYFGRFRLELLGEGAKKLDTIELSDLFEEEQSFPENMKLELEDYNQDGIQELCMGQHVRVPLKKLIPSKSAISAEKSVMGYYLINVCNTNMDIISDMIYLSDSTQLQSESVYFDYIPGADGVLTVPVEGEMSYYVWSQKDERYERKEMTEEEVKTLEEKSAAKNQAAAGQKKQYPLLDDDDRKMVQVNTEISSDGKEYIQSVVITPDQYAKTFREPDGQYHSLEWAGTADGQESGKRYAVLSYDDNNCRSFILFDVKEKKIIYQQPADNTLLKKLFTQYGIKKVSFLKDESVVYQLAELPEDGILNISFAAECAKGIFVRGSFQYETATQSGVKLEYSVIEN